MNQIIWITFLANQCLLCFTRMERDAFTSTYIVHVFMSQLVSTEIEFGRFISFSTFFSCVSSFTHTHTRTVRTAFNVIFICVFPWCFLLFYILIFMQYNYLNFWYSIHLSHFLSFFSSSLLLLAAFFLSFFFSPFFFLPFFVSFISFIAHFESFFYLVAKNIYITYLEWIQCQIRLQCY